jgi:hypothetical protein
MVPVTERVTFVSCSFMPNSATLVVQAEESIGAHMKKMAHVQGNVNPDPFGARQEVRCAVRFPLQLPVTVSTTNNEMSARTRNVSASGVLFELEGAVQTGSSIRFSLHMPGHVLGLDHDVLVQCAGRVVRCSLSQTHHLAAATIDEYQFAEQ